MDGAGWQLADTSRPVGPDTCRPDPQVLSLVLDQVGHQARYSMASIHVATLEHASASALILATLFHPFRTTVVPMPATMGDLSPQLTDKLSNAEMTPDA